MAMDEEMLKKAFSGALAEQDAAKKAAEAPTSGLGKGIQAVEDKIGFGNVTKHDSGGLDVAASLFAPQFDGPKPSSSPKAKAKDEGEIGAPGATPNNPSAAVTVTPLVGEAGTSLASAAAAAPAPTPGLSN